MAKLGDVKVNLAAAIAAGIIADVHRIVGRLRTIGWGPCPPFDYEDLWTFAYDSVRQHQPALAPTFTRAAWDATLAEVDMLDAGEPDLHREPTPEQTASDLAYLRERQRALGVDMALGLLRREPAAGDVELVTLKRRGCP